jgi:hypothetical protein
VVGYDWAPFPHESDWHWFWSPRRSNARLGFSVGFIDAANEEASGVSAAQHCRLNYALDTAPSSPPRNVAAALQGSYISKLLERITP